MKVFTRRRVRVVALVAAFVAAFAALGAVSRGTPTPGVPLPSAMWYWTMAVSPSDSKHLVVGTSSGLYRSSDGGKTWLPTGPKGIDATSVVQAGSSIYAGGVPVKQGASPIVRHGAARAAPNGTAVLAESTDGGKTWTDLHPRGLPNVSLQALAVGPGDNPALYAATTTGRLYRSTDGAGSFELVTSKLRIPPWALALTQNDHFVAGDMDTGAYESTDGRTWQRIRFADSRGGKMVMEYAPQPADTTRVLMTSFGIEMSTDGGKTWHRTLKSDVMFGPVAWASAEPDVAYAIGFDRSVWRSDDGGEKWTKVA